MANIFSGLFANHKNHLCNFVLYSFQQNNEMFLYPVRKNKDTFKVMVSMDMLIKFAPASVAMTFASSVLPMPGGPKSKISLQDWNRKNI